MAWEWVAPTATGIVGVAGAFFTWLAGSQGRTHAELMVERSEHSQERARIITEQRDAYLAALEFGELEVRRRRYQSEGRQDKLKDVDATFPKGERVRMSIAARAGLEAFGSPDVRHLVEEWRLASEQDDDEKLTEVFGQLRRQIRAELLPNESAQTAG